MTKLIALPLTIAAALACSASDDAAAGPPTGPPPPADFDIAAATATYDPELDHVVF